MVIGTTLFIVAILIIVIWVFVELKRFRHKMFAIFLILLIIFTYVSFTAILKGKDINLKTASGWGEATKLWFSWLGSIFKNLKTITVNAINMDWKSVNSTEIG